MKNKIIISSPTTSVIAIISVLFSLIIILPVYFYVPNVITPNVIAVYDVMGAGMSLVSTLVNKFYGFSYVFIILVFMSSLLLFFKGRKGGVGVGVLFLLFISLFLCMAWREFINFGLLVLVHHMTLIH